MLRRVGFWLIGVVAVAVALPWVAYWVGLSRVSHLPLPAPQAVTPDQREWVWNLAKASGARAVEPLTPFSYLYDMVFLKVQNDGSRRVIGWVASDHLINQGQDLRMFWWHLSTASLSIWLSRNWTDQQITAAAFVALQHRGEVYGGG